jgi:hypothetical protein
MLEQLHPQASKEDPVALMCVVRRQQGWKGNLGRWQRRHPITTTVEQ